MHCLALKLFVTLHHTHFDTPIAQNLIEENIEKASHSQPARPTRITFLTSGEDRKFLP